jgi:hypothetical protein
MASIGTIYHENLVNILFDVDIYVSTVGIGYWRIAPSSKSDFNFAVGGNTNEGAVDNYGLVSVFHVVAVTRIHNGWDCITKFHSNLWYDTDGSGKVKAVLLGVLNNNAELTANDVWIV